MSNPNQPTQPTQPAAGPSSNANAKSYKEQATEFYNRQYEAWMPWIEDKYLAWFTKDNKMSYSTKRKFIYRHAARSI